MEDKEMIEYVTLEDDLDYLVIDEIETENTTYLYLNNEEDPDNLVIRKVHPDNQIVPLDNEDEYHKALLLFVKKNKEEVTE